MTITEKEWRDAAEQELKGYQAAMRMLDLNRQAASEVNAKATGTTRVYGGHPGGGSPLPAAQSAVEQLEKLAEEHERYSKQLFEQARKILFTISKIRNPTYRELLHLHYITGISLKRACVCADRSEKLHYSYDWIKHLHRNALIAYGKEMGERIKE